MIGTPGMIATAIVRGRPGVRVMAASDGETVAWLSPLPVASFTSHPDQLVTDVVALTVLSVEITDADVAALTNAGGATLLALRDRLVAAQGSPTKPNEPLDRGAVVLDSDGRQWVRASAPGVRRGWVQFETRQTGVLYEEIKAVQVVES